MLILAASMKILFLCHRFPYPPKGGATIRSFHMISHLSRAHDLTVASLVRSNEEARDGEGIQDYCKNYLMERVGGPATPLRMLSYLPTGQPSSFGYFWSGRLAKSVRHELATTAYDMVVVHCSSMAPYVSEVRNIPKLLDFCDMDSQKWLAYGGFKPFPLSLGYYLEGLKLQLAEAALARDFDVCTCATLAEVRTLQGYNTDARADCFANGVDAERFQPSDQPYESDTICFVGRMDYFPNEECMVDFCENTLPLVRTRRPSVELLIVGAEPSRKVRTLARLDGVTVTGSVPEVQPYVHRAALSVVPLNIARGTQNKILESLAMGVPVVSSPLAAAGTDAVPGEHLLTARTHRDFADAILKLLADPTERARLSAAGRKRVLSHHSWEHSMRRLDDIVEDCVASFSRNPT